MPNSKVQDIELQSSLTLQPVASGLLRLTALLTGLSISLPLSSTLIAARFFDVRFEDAQVSYAFTSLYAAVFIGIKFLTVIAQTMFVNRQSSANVKNYLLGLAASLLCLLLLLVSSGVKGLELAGLIILLTLIKAVLISLIETSALALFAGCSSTITQSVFIGQGMAGIWTAGVSLFFQFLPGANDSFFAIANYGLSLVIVVGCAISWMFGASKLPSPPPSKSDGRRMQMTTIKSLGSKMTDLIAIVWFSNVFAMTMFPLLINKTQPVNLSTRLFYPVVFLVSNFADLLGKWLPSVISTQPKSGSTLSQTVVLTVSSRVLVFVAIITGNVLVDERKLPWKLYSSDMALLLWVLVSGVTHGFVTTLSAMRAPLRVPEDESLAATLLSLCSVGSSFVGSLLSLVLAYTLKSIV